MKKVIDGLFKAAAKILVAMCWETASVSCIVGGIIHVGIY